MGNKRPESVLVVIYSVQEQRVLMLQRNDDALFWQSVTGSLEADETPYMTACREVKEETGIDIRREKLRLIDTGKTVCFEIFPQFRHRYGAGITHNREHQFYLPLPTMREVALSEHSAYRWLTQEEAARLTKSWNNRDAIEQIVW